MVTMMVRLFAVALGLSAALGSFELDLIYRAPLRNNLRDRKSLLQKELLNKAKPLHEYYRDMGIDMSTQTHRALDQNYAETVYSFSGYSLKYAKCQPVQYFSDRAIRNGEHTPIALEDIVILRLCPQSSCISKQEYGCHYNYAEYAIDVSDYLKIMLQYSSDRTDALCNYCSECLANGQGGGNRKQRKVQEEYNDDQLNDDGQEEENDYAEDEQAQENGYADDAGNYGENQYANVAQNGYYDEYANACDGWNTYCSDYANMCSDNNNNYESVANYLDCAQVDYNYYSYFVRPRCDGTSNTIKMAIYYDKYCIQYAGNEVPVSYLNLGFKESMFKEYYNGTCMDCSDDESANSPYYGLDNTLCNNIHSSSAQCTNDLTYDLFEDQSNHTSECSFIESVRFGTYDEQGRIASSASAYGGSSSGSEVSSHQKILLVLSLAVCLGLIICACYLHHAMTNLLIKSLSHRELLPPSRNKNGARSSSRGRRGKKVGNDNGDWN